MNNRNTKISADPTATAQMLSNEELENIIIGSIVRYACEGTIVNDLPSIFIKISDSDFYNDTTQKLWKVIKSIYNSGSSLDLASVSIEAQKRGVNYSNTLDVLNCVCHSTTDLITNKIPQLKELSAKRTLWLIGQTLSNVGTSYQSNLNEAIESTIKSLLSINGDSVNTIVSGGDVIKSIIRTIDKNRNEGTEGIMTKTGFKDLDDAGGLCANDLCIIGAGTSIGKTSFATNIVINAMKEGKKIGFYSMEMSKEQIVSRMLSPYAELKQNEILRTKLSDAAVRMFDDAVIAFSEYQDNIFFDEKRGRTINDIKASIRYMHNSKSIDGVIIDYLGLIQKDDPKLSTQEHLANCARELKNLAMELNIWIIALVQLNRNSGEDNTPTLERLRDSAQIADASDMVIFIHRPGFEGKKYKDFPNVNPEGTAEIILAKNRNGMTTKFICGFDSKYTKFYPIDKVPVIACNARAAVTDYSNETPF